MRVLIKHISRQLPLELLWLVIIVSSNYVFVVGPRPVVLLPWAERGKRLRVRIVHTGQSFCISGGRKSRRVRTAFTAYWRSVGVISGWWVNPGESDAKESPLAVKFVEGLYKEQHERRRSGVARKFAKSKGTSQGQPDHGSAWVKL